jgi:hypothetical protein
MKKQNKTKEIQKILNVPSQVPGVFYSTEVVVPGFINPNSPITA